MSNIEKAKSAPAKKKVEWKGESRATFLTLTQLYGVFQYECIEAREQGKDVDEIGFEGYCAYVDGDTHKLAELTERLRAF